MKWLLLAVVTLALSVGVTMKHIPEKKVLSLEVLRAIEELEFAIYLSTLEYQIINGVPTWAENQ
jgi:hypothetical protein